jgi:catechol 2,3-dioxygenase-like lactoylglutathione lyase family enzyme
VLDAVTLVVRDYDEAIDWFVEKLGFMLREDADLGGGKRWVRVASPSGGSELLLARATNPDQDAAIGKAAGGRVAFFLQTADFDRDFYRMQSAGVDFLEAPRNEPYGKVVVFADLFGNKWDLIQAT